MSHSPPLARGAGVGVDEWVGRCLGPDCEYRLLRLLGRGGMGAVFEAEQVRLRRRVALKVLDPKLTSHPDFIKRFQREAEIIALLEHPHILPVYDYGEEQGLLYLVMRLISGGSLKDRLDQEGRRPWDAARALWLTRQIGPALDHAHARG
jgi:serine/threonine-protein kinase